MQPTTISFQEFRDLSRRFLRALRALVTAIALAVLASGCASYRAVDIDTPAGLSVLDAGDQVRVVTNDDRRHSFEVSHASQEVVAGDTVRLTRAEVATIERRVGDSHAGAAALGVGAAAVLWSAVYVAGAVLGAAIMLS